MAPYGDQATNADDQGISLACAERGSYSWLPAAHLLAWCLLLVGVSRLLAGVGALLLARADIAAAPLSQVVIGVSLEAATALAAGAAAWAALRFLQPSDRSRKACIRYTFAAMTFQCAAYGIGAVIGLYESRQSPTPAGSGIQALLAIPMFIVQTAAFPCLAICTLQRRELAGLKDEDRDTRALVPEACETPEADCNPPRLPQDQLRGWLRRLPRLTHSLPGNWSWAWLMRAVAWYLVAWGGCGLANFAAGTYGLWQWMHALPWDSPAWYLSLVAPLGPVQKLFPELAHMV